MGIANRTEWNKYCAICPFYRNSLASPDNPGGGEIKIRTSYFLQKIDLHNVTIKANIKIVVACVPFS